jgi:hypothetical protein
VYKLIDDCFSTSQFVAVRRILDNTGPDGERGVFSLLWLLRDMQKHSHLITREHIFAAERLKYDVKSVERKMHKYAAAQNLAGTNGYAVPNNLLPYIPNWRHAMIDHLTSIKPLTRAKTDAIQPNVFKCLIEKVEGAGRKIGVIVNKLVAHAATPTSRGHNTLKLRTTLGELWEAHRAICEAANFVRVHVLGRSHYGGLKVPQWDHLRYLDRPLATYRNIEHLRQVWRDFEQETRDWENWTPFELTENHRVRQRRLALPRDGWLWKNKRALAMVQAGLEQARKRQFVPGPDLAAGAKLIARMKHKGNAE